jgi:hypothetical protein
MCVNSHDKLVDVVRNDVLRFNYVTRPKILAISAVGTTVYAAVEFLNKPGSTEREVTAFVVLTSRKVMRGFNFGYNAYDENAGPFEVRCPVGILDMLTPTENEQALTWRARCRSYHADKRAATKRGKGLVENDIITFKNPLKFGSFEASRFQLLDKVRGHYMALYGETGMMKVRLSRALVSKSLLTGYATLDLSPTLAPTESGLAPTLTSRVTA